MTDMFQTGRNSSLFAGILPQKGNMGIGKLRNEKCVMQRQGYIHLKGPQIAVYHPGDYDTGTYRCHNGVNYETMIYGIAGIYDITASAWVTSDVDYVDPTRTTIYLTGTTVSTEDELIVYYYADSPVSGGDMNNLQGDSFLPDDVDILTKALNDAIPTIFGKYGDSGDGSPEFIWSADAGYNTGVTVSSGGAFVDLFDTSPVVGTSRWAGYPLYVNEITIKIPRAHNWSDYYDFKIYADDDPIFYGFANGVNYIRWEHFDPMDYTTGSTYDRHPGMMFGSASEPMFFDVYTDISSDLGTVNDCFRFKLGVCEVTSDLKISMASADQEMSNVAVYVRGWYISS